MGGVWGSRHANKWKKARTEGKERCQLKGKREKRAGIKKKERNVENGRKNQSNRLCRKLFKRNTDRSKSSLVIVERNRFCFFLILHSFFRAPANSDSRYKEEKLDGISRREIRTRN